MPSHRTKDSSALVSHDHARSVGLLVLARRRTDQVTMALRQWSSRFYLFTRFTMTVLRLYIISRYSRICGCILLQCRSGECASSIPIIHVIGVCWIRVKLANVAYRIPYEQGREDIELHCHDGGLLGQ